VVTFGFEKFNAHFVLTNKTKHTKIDPSSNFLYLNNLSSTEVTRYSFFSHLIKMALEEKEEENVVSVNMEHDDDDDHPIPEGHSSRNFRKRDSFELEAGTTSLSHQSKVIIYYFNYVNVIVICTLIILL
jgi:hypothetical protein